MKEAEKQLVPNVMGAHWLNAVKDFFLADVGGAGKWMSLVMLENGERMMPLAFQFKMDRAANGAQEKKLLGLKTALSATVQGKLNAKNALMVLFNVRSAKARAP